MANIGADVPLRSIESDNLSVYLTTPSSSSPSTPRSSRDGGRAGTSSRSARAQTNGLTSGLQNMRLADQDGGLHLNELNRAIDAVARSSDSRNATLSPEARGDDTRQRRRSRRASSRANPVRHEVSSEPPPDDAFHSPEFQAAFRDARRAMSDLERVLSSSSLHNEPGSTIGRLHEEAQELAAFQYPATRTVGFVGQSGVGKSSLLNSLLDRKDLARTSNSGEACTCVPTEYHYHMFQGITITVTLFTQGQLNDQITQLLRAYRRYHLNGSELDDADRVHAEQMATLAIATFRAMFRGLMRDEGFLVNLPEDEVLEILIDWAARARPVELSTRQTGLSLQAGSDALMELSTESAVRDQPAKWPYIKNINMFLDAHVLSRGLILVDLPGLRDLNVARRDITQRYLLECDEIFAICDSGRAVTDEGVRDVFNLAAEAGLTNIAIVCTRSDEIVASEALTDWQNDERGDAVREMMEVIRDDEREELDLQEELEDFPPEGEATQEERNAQYDLYRQRDAVRRRRCDHQFELQSFLIETRNEHIRQGLHAEYDSQISGENFMIFCVSNRIYWGNREEAADGALPYLSLSGIIDLRRRCMALVANSQRQIATRYMEAEIPALLAEIELWVRSGAPTASEERRARLRDALDEAERRLRRDLTSNTSMPNRMARLFKDAFNNQVYNRRDTSSWSRSARDAASDWQGWHHMTFSAFCRNYGTYSTDKVGYRNWNEEALNGMVVDLRDPWTSLRTSLEGRYHELENYVEEKADAACVQLATIELDDDEDVLITVSQGLNSQANLLLGGIERAQQQFESDIRLLGIDILSGIRTSLFGRAMEDSYRRCNAESGRGSDSRRKTIINTGVTREEVFRDLTRDARDSFRNHATSFQEAVQAAVRNYLQHAQSTFDMVRSEAVARESERDPDFRLRVEDAARDGRAVIDRIRSEVLS